MATFRSILILDDRLYEVQHQLEIIAVITMNDRFVPVMNKTLPIPLLKDAQNEYIEAIRQAPIGFKVIRKDRTISFDAKDSVTILPPAGDNIVRIQGNVIEDGTNEIYLFQDYGPKGHHRKAFGDNPDKEERNHYHKMTLTIGAQIRINRIFQSMGFEPLFIQDDMKLPEDKKDTDKV